MYSLVFVVCAKIVPMDKVGLCTGILTSCFAMASLLGPILGGVIADNTTWRVCELFTPPPFFSVGQILNSIVGFLVCLD